MPSHAMAAAPLPDELVTRLVKARLAENAARKAATDGARRSRVVAR